MNLDDDVTEHIFINLIRFMTIESIELAQDVFIVHTLSHYHDIRTLE